MPQTKNALAAVLVALIALGCASFSLPEGSTAQHRYFAALSDYNAAKVAALRYVQLPSTTRDEAEVVLEVVERADAELKRFEAVRQRAPQRDSAYSQIATVLEGAVAAIRAHAGPGGG